MSKDCMSLSGLLKYRDAFNEHFSEGIRAYRANLQQLERQYNRKAWQPFFCGHVENLSCNFPVEKSRRTSSGYKEESEALPIGSANIEAGQ